MMGRRITELLTRVLLRSEEFSPAYQAYLDELEQRQPSATKLSDIKFLVLDTETTGLDHTADRIVSFAAIQLQDFQFEVGKVVDWPIKSILPSEPQSIQVHGMLNHELEWGIPEREFTQRLLSLVGGKVIVGYKPGFDMAIINRVVREHHGARIRNAVLDVSMLAMRLDYPLKPAFVNPEAYRFDTLCERFYIEQPDRHTAMGDALATTLMLMKLLNGLRQEGVTTLGELLRRYP